ncbi:MAG: dTDP-4-dehydrorhamnose 3,5-epimerase [Acidobacteria bacterium]|nr:dTDP-4-dehydrorhamnose 3,5-epimerase [Acidobacteriota bacterium]MCI0718390.1 dTDP-4-dehydrorhamnose 3,5-epimerase [Acidobacteriota bacterium]
MVFSQAPLESAYIVDVTKIEDNRGFFARSWCSQEFLRRGLTNVMVQTNIGFNLKRGIVRGLHYQTDPHSEAKLIRCTRGAIYDVIVDLRPDSPTYKQWFGTELTEDNYRMIYAPEGVAHGYQTLTDNAEIVYQTSEFFVPEAATGVRYDDPAFTIDWPLPVQLVSARDRSWPDYSF